jgi:hypothetical protein
VAELWSEEGNQGRIWETEEETKVEVGEMDMEEGNGEEEEDGEPVRAKGPTKN